jgi:gamma-glutamyltranspeptidase/glutathione hydrolase
VQAKGGLIAEHDLIDYACEITEPISAAYRGYTVLEAPPNSTGFTLLQELRMAEQLDLRAMGLLSADSVHWLVEIKKLAFLDRDRWCADPLFRDAPLDELLSDEHARRLVEQIDPRLAARRPAGLKRQYRPAPKRPTSAWSTGGGTRCPASKASTMPSGPPRWLETREFC